MSKSLIEELPKILVKGKKEVIRVCVLVILSACMALLGCATLPTANPTPNPSGRTLIESDPPGARIEINNQYVGTTPLRVDIPRRSNYNWDNMEWDTISVKIIANPIIPGQQVQIKYIGYKEPTPTHVFFDMNLVRDLSN